jgi:hypothetical protein
MLGQAFFSHCAVRTAQTWEGPRLSRQQDYREQKMRIATHVASACAAILLAMPAAAVTVEAKVSPEFQKKLAEDIGVRETRVLTDALTNKVRSIFVSRGINAERVVVTIEDAKPNRPTFEQVSSKPGLDGMRSISLGGARITGVAYDAAGREIGTLDYDWYESDLSNTVGSTTWTDARTAFDRFSRRFADKLS